MPCRVSDGFTTGVVNNSRVQGSAFLLTEKEFHAAMPPTYFKSTEFTDPSQMLVSAAFFSFSI